METATYTPSQSEKPSAVASVSRSAKQTVGRARRAAKTIVGRQLDNALSVAGNRVSRTADTVRRIGAQLDESGEGAFAGDLAQTLAGYVDRFAAYLRNSDSDALAADIERNARRYPVAFAAGAFATGFALSRFVKVSSAERLRAGQPAYE